MAVNKGDIRLETGLDGHVTLIDRPVGDAEVEEVRRLLEASSLDSPLKERTLSLLSTLPPQPPPPDTLTSLRQQLETDQLRQQARVLSSKLSAATFRQSHTDVYGETSDAAVRALQSDARYLSRRLADEEARNERLESELKALRAQLLAGAPLVVMDEEAESGDESGAPAGSASLRKTPRPVTMGDAEAEHLLLAGKSMSHVRRITRVRLPRPEKDRVSPPAPLTPPASAHTHAGIFSTPRRHAHTQSLTVFSTPQHTRSTHAPSSGMDNLLQAAEILDATDYSRAVYSGDSSNDSDSSSGEARPPPHESPKRARAAYRPAGHTRGTSEIHGVYDGAFDASAFSPIHGRFAHHATVAPPARFFNGTDDDDEPQSPVAGQFGAPHSPGKRVRYVPGPGFPEAHATKPDVYDAGAPVGSHHLLAESHGYHGDAHGYHGDAHGYHAEPHSPGKQVYDRDPFAGPFSPGKSPYSPGKSPYDSYTGPYSPGKPTYADDPFAGPPGKPGGLAYSDEGTQPNGGAKRTRSPYVKWTHDEDVLLLRGVVEYGPRWDKVAATIPTRTYHQVRQRFLRGLKCGKALPEELSSFYDAVQRAVEEHAKGKKAEVEA